MTIDEFNQRLKDPDVFPPVLQIGADEELRHAPLFGELRDGGDRYIIRFVDEDHVYHCHREGGPYSKEVLFQGTDDQLWEELKAEVQ